MPPIEFSEISGLTGNAKLVVRSATAPPATSIAMKSFRDLGTIASYGTGYGGSLGDSPTSSE